MTMNGSPADKRPRIRELGIKIGRMEPGPVNAITDVPGVLVGHKTVIHGEPRGNLVKGIARTGVTVIFPQKTIWDDHLYAGSFSLNGNGEMTGLLWVEECGLLSTPIGLTNTHSVGLVRDSIISWFFRNNPDSKVSWMLPVVTETWDGYLNDINGMHVTREHVFEALDSASSGPVQEGAVGGGTGMTCHEFKGGIGTSSRLVPIGGEKYTVGTLVQTNYGARYHFLVKGVPVGEEIPTSEIPGREDLKSPTPEFHEGSIIIIIATNAPLLADQCKRLARRSAMGLSRVGSFSADCSGDIFLAFSTGNVVKSNHPSGKTIDVKTLSHESMTMLFEAVTESVEESILNALCAAVTTNGIRNRIVYSLPTDRLVQVLGKYGRA